MTKRIDNPLPLWLDRDGNLLDGGKIYVGTAGMDPQVSPVNVYWDEALTIIAVQPLETRGGHIVGLNGNPAQVFTAADDWSIRSRDFDGQEVIYLASTLIQGTQFQPLDADLTAISALLTTPYGRGLLTLANQAALKAATGIPDPLPAIGGSITGNITRQGAGVHLYHNNEALGSGHVMVTVAGAPDPTSLPGDIWLEEAP